MSYDQFFKQLPEFVSVVVRENDVETVIPATCDVELPEFPCAHCIEVAVERKIGAKKKERKALYQSLDSVAMIVVTGVVCGAYFLIVLVGAIVRTGRTFRYVRKVREYHHLVYAAANAVVGYEHVMTVR